MAEAADLKSVKCQFESDRGHQNNMKKIILYHLNADTMTVKDLKGVLAEYESLIRVMYNSTDYVDDYARMMIESSLNHINVRYPSYEGKVVTFENNSQENK
jgi:hypothetical protein